MLPWCWSSIVASEQYTPTHIVYNYWWLAIIFRYFHEQEKQWSSWTSNIPKTTPTFTTIPTTNEELPQLSQKQNTYQRNLSIWRKPYYPTGNWQQNIKWSPHPRRRVVNSNQETKQISGDESLPIPKNVADHIGRELIRHNTKTSGKLMLQIRNRLRSIKDSQDTFSQSGVCRMCFFGNAKRRTPTQLPTRPIGKICSNPRRISRTPCKSQHQIW